MLIFDDSCEEICISKSLLTLPLGDHRGLITIYSKHNLFHQNNLGRDVEVEFTNFVLSQTSADVMQVSPLSAQLVLGSELV